MPAPGSAERARPRPASVLARKRQASPAMQALLRRIRACTACAGHLPHGPRPVFTAGPAARIVIIGQAPGAKVHASGVAWDDASGRLLRTWLEVDEATFYDTTCFALVPMGFCYPGRGPAGDLPPRPECAPQWHAPLFARMPRVRLTLLVGQYSQRGYLGARAGATLTETVRAFATFLPGYLPLPHPSPRNRPWFARHPWFERELLPVLRAQVRAALADGEPGPAARPVTPAPAGS